MKVQGLVSRKTSCEEQEGWGGGGSCQVPLLTFKISDPSRHICPTEEFGLGEKGWGGEGPINVKWEEAEYVPNKMFWTSRN